MKISLTTLSDNENLGTFLQIHALSRILQERGHEVELVRYTRRSAGLAGGIRERMGKRSQGLLRRLTATAYGVVEHIRVRNRMFRFLRKQIKITRNYRSFEEIQRDPPLADVYLTGSDQVWNSLHNRGLDRVMYLDFAPEGKRRLAYAASFGIEELPEQEIEPTTALLRKYERISVRESSARQLIESLGITGVEDVLDPTLLLDRQAWAELAAQSKLDVSEPYVLIYSVEPKRNEVVLAVAREAARRLGCKVAMLTPNGYRKVIAGVDKAWTGIGPEDFVHLFLNARFVVCSSFHGTAFSVNLQRPFVSIRPTRFVARARDFLERCGLVDRLIDGDEVDWETLLSEPSFEESCLALNAGRTHSLEYLKLIASNG